MMALLPEPAEAVGAAVDVDILEGIAFALLSLG